MATHNYLVGSIELCWANKAKHSNAGTSTAPVATPANYASPSAIETRLATINAGYYTTANLAKMTLNDKIYALRLNDDATTI